MKKSMLSVALRASMLVAILSGITLAQDEADARKRVAVMSFDTSTVDEVGTSQNLGQQIADILLNRLVSSRKYRVLERKALEKILAEQNNKFSDRFDGASVAKLGRLAGVEGIMIGEVTHYSLERKKCHSGTFKFLEQFGAVKKCKETAEIRISARMIATETGENVFAAEGAGRVTRDLETSFENNHGSASSSGASPSNLARSLAVRQAVEQIMPSILEMDENLPRLRVERSLAEGNKAKKPEGATANGSPGSSTLRQSKQPSPPPAVEDDGVDRPADKEKGGSPSARPSGRFTIELGPYRNELVAARVVPKLKKHGVNGDLVRIEVPKRDALYAIQIGDFSSRSEAKTRAARLVARGVIQTYEVVPF